MRWSRSRTAGELVTGWLLVERVESPVVAVRVGSVPAPAAMAPDRTGRGEGRLPTTDRRPGGRSAESKGGVKGVRVKGFRTLRQRFLIPLLVRVRSKGSGPLDKGSRPLYGSKAPDPFTGLRVTLLARIRHQRHLPILC